MAAQDKVVIAGAPTSGHLCPRIACRARPDATASTYTNPATTIGHDIDLRLGNAVTSINSRERPQQRGVST